MTSATENGAPPVPATTAVSPAADVVARVQELQAALENRGDPATRELAEELVAAVIEMYGAGLAKIFATLAGGGETGGRIARELAEDPDVGSLLLIHDLHPVPLERRVAEALEKVRPYMESHGGNVELLALEDGVARIRLQGSCSDCRASSATLELAIKQALDEAAPDLWGLEVEGASIDPMTGMQLPMANDPDPARPATPASLFELPVVNVADGPSPAGEHGAAGAPVVAPAWYDVEGVAGLGRDQLQATRVAGAELVIGNVDGTLLAYHNRCAACEASLDRGELSGGALSCPACGRAYFLPRAGRSLDGENVQLEPVPLLAKDGHVRVALAL